MVSAGSAAMESRGPPARLFAPMRRVALLLASTAACAAPLDTVVLEAPAAHPEFPALFEASGLFVQASFFAEEEQVFGLDLVGRDVLAVGVRIGTVPGAESLWLDEERGRPQLYLEDGTALEGIASDELATEVPATDERLEKLALPPGPLGSWDRSGVRFLYFRIEPPVRVSREHALSRGGGVWRELELERSLLVFSVESPEGPRAVQVGLRSALWDGPKATPFAQ